jgi:hypothetical protein
VRQIQPGSQGRFAPARCAAQSVQTGSWSRPNSTLAPLRRIKNGSVREGEQLSHNESTEPEFEGPLKFA